MSPFRDRDELRRERLDRPAPASMGASAEKATAQAQTPERELERIAALRREGRHDEADKALADFRKRNPEYRISEPMLRRVERP